MGTVTSILMKETRILKSGLSPLVVTLKVQGANTPYKMIFKEGDDLRNEELVLRFLRTAQKILPDTKLTCYNAIALTEDTGFLEFVTDADTLGDINNIESYLESESAMDTFVKTAA